MKTLIPLNIVISIFFLIATLLFPMPMFIKGLAAGAVIIYLVFVSFTLSKRSFKYPVKRILQKIKR